MLAKVFPDPHRLAVLVSKQNAMCSEGHLVLLVTELLCVHSVRYLVVHVTQDREFVLCVFFCVQGGSFERDGRTLVFRPVGYNSFPGLHLSVTRCMCSSQCLSSAIPGVLADAGRVGPRCVFHRSTVLFGGSRAALKAHISQQKDSIIRSLH